VVTKIRMVITVKNYWKNRDHKHDSLPFYILVFCDQIYEQFNALCLHETYTPEDGILIK